jgi:hypothetical protein
MSLIADTLEATACHESGHAVAGYVLGRQITRISILPHEAGNGRTLFTELWHRRRQEVDATIFLAGPIAEGVYRGHFNLAGAQDDVQGAVAELRRLHFVEGCSLSNNELERHLAEVTERAGEIIAANWPSVVALATKLLARPVYSGRTVRRILLSAGATRLSATG